LAAAPAFWGVVVAIVVVRVGDVALPACWGVRDVREVDFVDAVGAATVPACWGCVGEREDVDFGEAARPRAFGAKLVMFAVEADDKFCEAEVKTILCFTIDVANRLATICLACVHGSIVAWATLAVCAEFWPAGAELAA
jgi:hypothetical protein